MEIVKLLFPVCCQLILIPWDSHSEQGLISDSPRALEQGSVVLCTAGALGNI